MDELKRRRRAEHGYSLIELMIVVGIMGVVTGIAVLQIGSERQALAGDGAMRVVLSQLNQARELAITQRRNMRLSFTGTSVVQIVREEVPGPTLTTLSQIPFEGGLQFLTVAGLPDTPDAFGNATAVSFAAAAQIKFTPNGTLVDQNGNLLNGTVFVALAGQMMSARAVTIFGSTGRVRAFRWDGNTWRRV
jgi:prepilin-type N-terminal cleavage/methylation domain-containing protein